MIPIGFYWNGAQIVVCTAPTAPKVRALAINTKVPLTIDTETSAFRVLLLRGTASSEVIDGVPVEYLEASKKGGDTERWQEFEAQVRAMYKQMARIVIVPEWAKVYDFGTGWIPSFLARLAEARERHQS